ncbi:membrane hypothetical protein [Microcystis aeruginosa PCC 9807]|uniref:Uncharacterized protein n=1 Tax=Microcystis aeruginosa PCC 9807 TaxID=1160283 RepID=I4H8C1_MICAE|nr:hypothetical protein [Microcystis aeruginosa]CCI18295.1 membrane hypothetical protein [Microcystis aeruginosa PCC 9807]
MTFSPSAWLTPFFYTPLWRAGGVSITLGWIIGTLVLFILVTCLTIAFKSLLKNRLLKSIGFDEGNREAIATLASFAFGAFGYIKYLGKINYTYLTPLLPLASCLLPIFTRKLILHDYLSPYN